MNAQAFFNDEAFGKEVNLSQEETKLLVHY